MWFWTPNLDWNHGHADVQIPMQTSSQKRTFLTDMIKRSIWIICPDIITAELSHKSQIAIQSLEDFKVNLMKFQIWCRLIYNISITFPHISPQDFQNNLSHSRRINQSVSLQFLIEFQATWNSISSITIHILQRATENSISCPLSIFMEIHMTLNLFVY